MKKLLKIALATLLTLTLLASAAALACEEGQYVYYDCYGNSYIWNYGYVVATDGSSYIRSAPGLYGEIVGCLSKGCTAIYRGASNVDERGVRWDYVYYNGHEGWISSRYTTLY